MDKNNELLQTLENMKIHDEVVLKDTELDLRDRYKRAIQWVMKVPGGFIYYMRVSVRYVDNGCAEAVTSTFVPDCQELIVLDKGLSEKHLS